MNKTKFKIAKWIMMSLAIISNAFIVFYSCLSEDGTKRLNTPFTNAFINFVNTITKKEVNFIPVSSVELRLSNNDEHVYNNISGYEKNEVPLGSAKEIRCSLLPLDASDQSVVFDVSPKGSVVINQSGLTASVVGMQVGDCTIKVKSHNGNYESSLNLKVVDTKGPADFEVSYTKPLNVGEKDTLNFDIDGGILGHNELINFRYYDVKKLSYTSNDNSVATVNDQGIITGISEGTTNIIVSNSLGIEKSVEINVYDGGAVAHYENLNILGSSICYSNDMILDQNSHNNHFQLVPRTGDSELNPDDFIWESSNDLLARVDSHGVLRGFRKQSNEDEHVTIKAISKKTGQHIYHEVTVKVQLPTKMVFSLLVGGKEIWSPSEYTVSVGGKVSIKLYFTPGGCDKTFIVASSNEGIISCTTSGDTIDLNIINEGVSTITIESKVKKELSVKTTITVVKAGAISSEDVSSVNHSIRKGVGHSAVFMVAQIFTFLTLYMFFFEKKWWTYSLVSLSEGLLVSILSELIQFFVPTRTGSIIDVIVDFVGVIVGFITVFVVLIALKKIKFKKSDKSNVKT